MTKTFLVTLLVFCALIDLKADLRQTRRQLELINPDAVRTALIELHSSVKVINLGGDVTINFTKIPAGKMTTTAGKMIFFTKPLWVETHEIGNRQFAEFNAAHDSRIETGDFLQFGVAERGFPCNLPLQPVSHVSALEAEEFYIWLSRKTGMRCRLPTADEWQWFARAGSNYANQWKERPQEFNRTANLADKSFNAVQTLGWGLLSRAIPPWRKAALDVDDGHRVCSPAGEFKANQWGLFDTIGNVWEWTTDVTRDGDKIACGGSWATRPQKAGFNSRIAYKDWQKVYDVGFRIVMENVHKNR